MGVLKIFRKYSTRHIRAQMLSGGGDGVGDEQICPHILIDKKI